MTTRTGRTVTLRLPLPPRALSPNGQFGTWRTHSTAARDYRALCHYEALPQLVNMPRLDRVRLSWQFIHCRKNPLRDQRCTPGKHHANCGCDYRPRDLDNAIASACKRVTDALVDAHLLRSDDYRHVAFGTAEILKCKVGCKCGGGVVVTVEEMTA